MPDQPKSIVFLHLAGLLSLVLAAAGCGSIFGSSPKPATTVEPAALVQQCLDNRAVLSSLQAEAAMRILDRPHKFSLRINTEILAQKPARLRLQATKALGKIEIFDTVMEGQDILFYVPRKRTLYSGQVRDLSPL